jgi:hypothetical protein
LLRNTEIDPNRSLMRGECGPDLLGRRYVTTDAERSGRKALRHLGPNPPRGREPRRSRPCSAKARADAAPKPDTPPVTTASLPRKSNRSGIAAPFPSKPCSSNG